MKRACTGTGFSESAGRGRAALRAAALLALAILAGGGCVSRLFYHPDQRVYRAPGATGPSFEEVWFVSRDGTLLHGWFFPAMGTTVGTVVHFHGNAQNLTAHVSFVDWLPREGFNLLVFDYRGYGQSAGVPSRRGLYWDGQAALQYAAFRPDVDPERMVVLGQSLGAANAVWTVAHTRFPAVRALALESCFYSYRGITRDKIALLPVVRWLRWPLSGVLLSDRYSPGAAIREVAPVPVLIVHGTHDRIVPFEHGRRLHARAAPPREFWEIQGGGHTPAFIAPDSPYRAQLVQFFRAALDADR
jgi:fermentation-respiration switch protein FrsA (DUF1100 family)